MSLGEKQFVLILNSTEVDIEVQKSLIEKATAIVKEWQATQNEFKNFEFQIVFETPNENM